MHGPCDVCDMLMRVSSLLQFEGYHMETCFLFHFSDNYKNELLNTGMTVYVPQIVLCRFLKGFYLGAWELSV